MLSHATLCSPTRSFVVTVSPSAFRCAWVLIVLLHVMHGAMLLRAVYSQVMTLQSPDEVGTNLRLTGKRFNPPMFYIAVGIELIFSTYHVLVILNLVRYSIQARTLMLVDPHASNSWGASVLGKLVQRLVGSIDRMFSKSSATVRHWKYLYGIRGPYFEHAFHLKESYEVFWESIQLYRCVYQVVHRRIQSLVLAVLVLNCWTTPVIYRCFPLRNHRASRLVLWLIVDAVLDFISSITIPFAVYFCYRALLADRHTDDAEWSFAVGSDLAQFTPTDYTGIVARLLPTMSMVVNLASIKPVIKRDTDPTISVTGPTKSLILPNPVPPPANKSVISQDVAATSRHPRWMLALHPLLISWGVACITFINIKARNAEVEGVPQCKVVMHHWHASKLPCAVLKIACDRDTNATDILDKVDASVLRTLSFLNCASLTMHDAIQQFSNLNWLEIRNSTVISWPRSAALTQTSSPHLDRIIFAETNFTGFPQALYSEAINLPASLFEITFAGTNLTDLPSNLHKVWPQPMASIHLERGTVTHVPTVLLGMEVEKLSLAGNRITDIPRDLFSGKTFTVLSLSNNPIGSLPDTLSAPFHLRRPLRDSDPHGLWLVNTNVSCLPEWILPANCSASGLVMGVYAEESPCCAVDASQRNCGELSWQARVQCKPPLQLPWGISSEGFLFPKATLAGA